jgi:hypothetical protein
MSWASLFAMVVTLLANLIDFSSEFLGLATHDASHQSFGKIFSNLRRVIGMYHLNEMGSTTDNVHGSSFNHSVLVLDRNKMPQLFNYVTGVCQLKNPQSVWSIYGSKGSFDVSTKYV